MRLSLVAPFLLFTESARLVDDRARFFGLTAVLLCYLAVECLEIRRERTRGWLLCPAVLASIATFGISFGVSNLALADPEGYPMAQLALGLADVAKPYAALCSAMQMIILGAVCMWIGYRSRIATMIGASVRRGLVERKWIIQSGHPRWSVVVLLLAIGVVARLIMISLGVFGYSAETENLFAYASYTQVLYTGAEASMLALVVVALWHHGAPSKKSGPIFAALLATEVLFGLLSGAKAYVVRPVIAAGMCAYAMLGRARWRYVGFAGAAVMLAYAVIEPFRIARYLDPTFEGNSLTSIVSTMKTATEASAALSADEVERTVWQTFLFRNNQTEEAAVATHFAMNNTLPPDSPAFLKSLLLSPAMAVVPRMLWSTKPLENVGFWYSQTVWHSTSQFNSSAMSPVGFLFFAGGTWMVAIGFFVIGAFQRVVYEIFVDTGIGGLLILLGVLAPLVMIDNSVNTLFASEFRMIPMLVAVQWLVYERSNDAPAVAN